MLQFVKPEELLNRTTLNRIIDIQDFNNPELIKYMQALTLPIGQRPPQRKWWEWASLLNGLGKLNLLKPYSKCISVGAGTEYPLFWIANKKIHTFCIDLYSDNSKWSGNAPEDFLKNPKNYSPVQTDENFLLPMYMSGTELNFADNTFDFAFSMSSIEHFGGHEATKKSMQEIHRTLKKGGIACIVTELILNNTTNYEFLTPDEIQENIMIEGFELIGGEMDWRVNQDISPFDMDKPDDWNIKPHIIVKWGDCIFTSVIVWLKKI